MTFRPLLAASIEGEQDLAKLAWPMLGSPKLDGIRCIIHPELGPVTRSLKPIANKDTRQFYNQEKFHGFDGELIVGKAYGEGVFARTSSGIMSHDGTPMVQYHIFDSMLYPGDGYLQRYEGLPNATDSGAYEGVIRLPYKELRDPDECLEFETKAVESGFEGIMVRSLHGKYKFGRSTFKEGTLLKMKRFVDEEATVIGFEPLYRNTNEKLLDNLGLAKRSSHQAGMIADDLLGKLVVESSKWGTFSIGSGLDVSLRKLIWNAQESYLGKSVTFKYQPVGTLASPRQPIFKGFREDL